MVDNRMQLRSLIEKNIGVNRKLGFVFLPTDEYLEDMKLVNNRILGVIELSIINQKYGYCSMNTINLDSNMLESTFEIIDKIMISYSYDIIDYVTLDINIEKIIEKKYSLQDVREALGFSQSKLADIFEVKQPYLSALEKGKYPISVRMIKILMDMVPLMDFSCLLISEGGNNENT